MYYLYFSDLINHKKILCLQIKNKTVNQFAFVGENFSKIGQETPSRHLFQKWWFNMKSYRKILGIGNN